MCETGFKALEIKISPTVDPKHIKERILYLILTQNTEKTLLIVDVQVEKLDRLLLPDKINKIS